MTNTKMNTQKGFTLIEIMIALVIVAILAAVALPSYRGQVVRTRRAAAETCLMELAQFMERFYTVNLAYDKTTGGKAVALPAKASHQCQKDLDGFYTFSLSSVKSREYALLATPAAAQPDTQCGALTLDQAGVKGLKDSKLKDNVAKCWK